MNKIFSFIILICYLGGCIIDNYSIEISLPKCQKLVSVTWKHSNLWYLSRPMRSGEVPETWFFSGSEDFDNKESRIIFRETCR